MTWWHKVISQKLISHLAHDTQEFWTGSRPESTSASEALLPTSYCQYLRFEPSNLLSSHIEVSLQRSVGISAPSRVLLQPSFLMYVGAPKGPTDKICMQHFGLNYSITLEHKCI